MLVWIWKCIHESRHTKLLHLCFFYTHKSIYTHSYIEKKEEKEEDNIYFIRSLYCKKSDEKYKLITYRVRKKIIYLMRKKRAIKRILQSNNEEQRSNSKIWRGHRQVRGIATKPRLQTRRSMPCHAIERKMCSKTVAYCHFFPFLAPSGCPAKNERALQNKACNTHHHSAGTSQYLGAHASLKCTPTRSYRKNDADRAKKRAIRCALGGESALEAAPETPPPTSSHHTYTRTEGINSLGRNNKNMAPCEREKCATVVLIAQHCDPIMHKMDRCEKTRDDRKKMACGQQRATHRGLFIIKTDSNFNASHVFFAAIAASSRRF